LRQTEEPDYIVTSATDADVSVLESKDWFDWQDESQSLLPGIPLIFRVTSEVSFKIEFHSASFLYPARSSSKIS